MQEVRHDDTKGKVRTADTLEDLLPEIKKSLANPNVKYVKVFFLSGTEGFKSEVEEKSFLDRIPEIDEALKEEKK